jgi:hypothetical protein
MAERMGSSYVQLIGRLYDLPECGGTMFVGWYESLSSGARHWRIVTTIGRERAECRMKERSTVVGLLRSYDAQLRGRGADA